MRNQRAQVYVGASLYLRRCLLTCSQSVFRNGQSSHRGATKRWQVRCKVLAAPSLKFVWILLFAGFVQSQYLWVSLMLFFSHHNYVVGGSCNGLFSKSHTDAPRCPQLIAAGPAHVVFSVWPEGKALAQSCRCRWTRGQGTENHFSASGTGVPLFPHHWQQHPSPGFLLCVGTLGSLWLVCVWSKMFLAVVTFCESSLSHLHWFKPNLYADETALNVWRFLLSISQPVNSLNAVRSVGVNWQWGGHRFVLTASRFPGNSFCCEVIKYRLLKVS